MKDIESQAIEYAEALNDIADVLDMPDTTEIRKDLLTALQWINDGDDQEGRDLIVEPLRAKYFAPKADTSLDSENNQVEARRK